MFQYLGKKAYGISNAYHAEKQDRKSIGKSNTFRPTKDHLDIKIQFQSLAHQVEEQAKKLKVEGLTVSIQVKSSKFENVTRACRLPFHINNWFDLLNCAEKMFNDLNVTYAVRLVGLRLETLRPWDGSQGPSKMYSFFLKADKPEMAEKTQKGVEKKKEKRKSTILDMMLKVPEKQKNESKEQTNTREPLVVDDVEIDLDELDEVLEVFEMKEAV